MKRRAEVNIARMFKVEAGDGVLWRREVDGMGSIFMGVRKGDGRVLHDRW